ncbi:hypothetical protein ACCO45_009955 [Purpureocillium lilacinum]|uniref:Uncharacterized protein n=1 Tax=Purpureocillium lilacinum TaxID=33203 RepID=A0ACC4DEZ6_PURLI
MLAEYYGQDQDENGRCAATLGRIALPPSSTKHNGRTTRPPDLASDRSAVATHGPHVRAGSYLSSRSDVPSGPISTLLQAATRTATLGSLVTNTLSPASQISTQEKCVSDLCSNIRKWREQEQCDPGLIPDSRPEEPKLYVVYQAMNNPGEYRDRTPELSLGRVLARVPGAPWLGYRDKVHLAIMISTTVLQLHSTPWLSDFLSPADILFLGKQDENYYREFFLRKNLRLPRVPKILCHKLLHMPQRDPILLSLGFVLISLLLGNILEFDDIICESCRIERQWVAAQEVLRRVRQESPNYFRAVAWCLDGELHGLQRHKMQGELNFERKVYSGIIAPLKADLEAL